MEEIKDKVCTSFRSVQNWKKEYLQMFSNGDIYPPQIHELAILITTRRLHFGLQPMLECSSVW